MISAEVVAMVNVFTYPILWYTFIAKGKRFGLNLILSGLIIQSPLLAMTTKLKFKTYTPYMLTCIVVLIAFTLLALSNVRSKRTFLVTWLLIILQSLVVEFIT